MAVDVVDQLLQILEDEALYVFHEIVHNRHVVDRFKDRGVTFVESIADVPEGGIVVFSAHGISPAVRQAACDRNLIVIDATCPLVMKVHAEAIRYAKQGFQILLVGHHGHQEVIGTMGEAPDAIQVVESPECIPSLAITDPTRLVYLTQTTLSMDDADRVIRALKEAFPQIKSPPSDDICYATTNRQQAMRHLAAEADLVLVVGSVNSSNSQRLVEIAQTAGATAWLIDDCSALDPAWLHGVEMVVVSAGASAPEDLVQDLLIRLATVHGGDIEQHTLYDERVEFGLPGTLKKFMRQRGVDPTGQSIAMDAVGDTVAVLKNRGIPCPVHEVTVDGMRVR
jgi:4-hydroxy-3-methylbut-2-enyl diphosphate reductase